MEYDKKDHHLQFELDIIWTALQGYGATCLDNKLGQDADSMEYAVEWANICEAMSIITDSLCDGEGCGPQDVDQDNWYFNNEKDKDFRR
jgi:hypothetical protein